MVSAKAIDVLRYLPASLIAEGMCSTLNNIFAIAMACGSIVARCTGMIYIVLSGVKPREVHINDLYL